jgi:hypothetical protein
VLGVNVESTPLIVLAVILGVGLVAVAATRLGAPSRRAARRRDGSASAAQRSAWRASP